MKLYYMPGACSLATHIVLEWIGAKYETVKMDLQSMRAPEYLALNPSGAVPLLVDGDFLLTQNAAILYYLADLHPEARLLGDGTALGRADVMRWLCLLNSDVHPAFKPIFKPGYFHADPKLGGALSDMARTHVREHLERLDARLEGRNWLAGQRSIADPYLFVLLRWMIRLQIDARDLSNLARFFSRMYDDVGVRTAVITEEGSIKDENWPTSRLNGSHA